MWVGNSCTASFRGSYPWQRSWFLYTSVLYALCNGSNDGVACLPARGLLRLRAFLFFMIVGLYQCFFLVQYIEDYFKRTYLAHVPWSPNMNGDATVSRTCTGSSASENCS
jgi:hypothetical protein